MTKKKKGYQHCPGGFQHPIHIVKGMSSGFDGLNGLQYILGMHWFGSRSRVRLMGAMGNRDYHT
jgi:hypothetical protein